MSEMTERLITDIQYVTGMSRHLLSHLPEKQLRVLYARHKCHETTTDTTGTSLAAGVRTHSDKKAEVIRLWRA
jgi:DNA-binding IclR family transcriptional regulator